MEASQKKSTRKKFLLWGAAIIGTVTALKFISGRKEEPEPESDTIKMLTQDGTLVEIDRKLLAASGKKISNVELQHWIKK